MTRKALLGLAAAIAVLPLLAPAAASAREDHAHESQKAKFAGLKKVESKKVCMINNQVFDKDQIPVEVEGKTYFGCCAMCKERLAKDAESRKAVDPVSLKEVDKASAVIGADAEGNVHYFENEKNLEAFNAKKD